MSRTRARKDPFWATGLSSMKAGPRGIVRELHAAVNRSGMEDVVWFGSGWRPNSVEHNSGTSIDIMVVENVGIRPSARERAVAMALINWLIKHHVILGIEGILFSRDGGPRTEVWGYSTPGRGWRALANRGSVPGNHIDHIHVKFKSTASWPSALNGVIIPGGSGSPTPAPKPGLPTTGVNNKSVTEMAKEIVAGKHGNGHTNRQRSLNVDAETYAKVRAEVNRITGVKASDQGPAGPPPFPLGIAPNRKSPSAVLLQRQLKKAGFMPKTVKEDPNYGPETQAAVARFHNRYTQFRNSKVTRDIAIGPKGWKFLFEKL